MPTLDIRKLTQINSRPVTDKPPGHQRLGLPPNPCECIYRLLHLLPDPTPEESISRSPLHLPIVPPLDPVWPWPPSRLLLPGHPTHGHRPVAPVEILSAACRQQCLGDSDDELAALSTSGLQLDWCRYTGFVWSFKVFVYEVLRIHWKL